MSSQNCEDKQRLLSVDGNGNEARQPREKKRNKKKRQRRGQDELIRSSPSATAVAVTGPRVTTPRLEGLTPPRRRSGMVICAATIAPAGTLRTPRHRAQVHTSAHAHESERTCAKKKNEKRKKRDRRTVGDRRKTATRWMKKTAREGPLDATRIVPICIRNAWQ